MTRHLISCSLAYSYCSVRLGSWVGTNSAWWHERWVSIILSDNTQLCRLKLLSTLKFSSHNSATSSMRSSNRPPPPFEQTRILVLASFLTQLKKSCVYVCRPPANKPYPTICLVWYWCKRECDFTCLKVSTEKPEFATLSLTWIGEARFCHDEFNVDPHWTRHGKILLLRFTSVFEFPLNSTWIHIELNIWSILNST